MRITFLVGNGFDLNCGLHTQYSDFYKYFIEKHPQNTIACEIADNPENWADLELSIGKYIEKVSGENRETFLNDLAELEEELRDYLQSENQRIRWTTRLRRVRNSRCKTGKSIYKLFWMIMNCSMLSAIAPYR